MTRQSVGRFDMQRGAPARPSPGLHQPCDHDTSGSALQAEATSLPYTLYPNLYMAGVKERFGAADLERLEREGEVPLEWRGGKDKQPIRWTLTKKARSPAPYGEV